MGVSAKDAIKASFMELVNQKPLNKITIKDIVEHCNINRNSFYYHYADLPALIEEIFLEDADRFIQNQNTSESIYECIISVIDYAMQNKTAVFHIFHSTNRELFDRYLGRISEYAVTNYIEKVSVDYSISDADKDAIIMYYKCQLTGFVIDWLGSGMNYDLCDKIKRICTLFEGTMKTAFERGSK